MAARARRARSAVNRARRAVTGKGKSRVTRTRTKVYGKLRDREHMSQAKAARIANKGKTREGRSEMAKKGWETRRRRAAAT